MHLNGCNWLAGLFLSAAAQDMDGPARALDTRRVTLGFDGAQLTLYASALTRHGTDIGAGERTQTRGLSAELYGDRLLPETLGLGAWAPTLLSVSIEDNATTKGAPGLPVGEHRQVAKQKLGGQVAEGGGVGFAVDLQPEVAPLA